MRSRVLKARGERGPAAASICSAACPACLRNGAQQLRGSSAEERRRRSLPQHQPHFFNSVPRRAARHGATDGACRGRERARGESPPDPAQGPLRTLRSVLMDKPAAWRWVVMLRARAGGSACRRLLALALSGTGVIGLGHGRANGRMDRSKTDVHVLSVLSVVRRPLSPGTVQHLREDISMR